MKTRVLNCTNESGLRNLTWVGNIGSSAILAALDEFCSARKLKSVKNTAAVPESGRFFLWNSAIKCRINLGNKR